MRRLLGLFACLALLCLVPIRARGEDMGLTLGAMESSPFLTSFRQSQELGQDFACLYRLRWADTSVLAYRAFPRAEASSGQYLPGNPESSTEVAGKLRGVMLGGYPAKPVSQLQSQANAWLASRGREPVEELQSGEAMLATQLALWRLLGACESRETYSGWKDFSASGWASLRKQAETGETLFQKETAHTKTNVEGLTAYLESLPAVAPAKPLVWGLQNGEYASRQEGDGTWTVEVRLSLQGTVEQGDSLTLHAQCGSDTQEQSVERAGVYTVSFSGLETPAGVTVTLSGTQRGEGVYSFRSGETELLGFVQGSLPVWSQAELTPDRILRLKKTTPEEQGSQPLANIQFNLYLAATREQLERREVRLSPTPTAAEVAACQSYESLKAILSTDETGVASYNFTAGGDPDGVYLVVEQYSAATTGPVDPFYITVPGEDSYSLDIPLENQMETLSRFTLETTDGASSYALGQHHQWRMTAALPAGLGSARGFSLTQSFPDALSWEPDSLLVELYPEEGEPLGLLEGAHYTVTKSEGTLTLSLTPAGMAYSAARGEGGSLSVSYLAALTSKAAPGASVPSFARLEYENSAGIRFSKTARGPSLTLGNLHLTKQTNSGRPVSGAVYRLARPAKPEDASVSYLKVDGNSIPVVYVAFRKEQTYTGEPVTQVTTGEDGESWFSGLAYGTYYLVESRSAPGYRTEEPIAVTLDAGKVEVTACARFLLPNTGSAGALALSCLGTVATVAACWLLLWDKREKQRV